MPSFPGNFYPVKVPRDLRCTDIGLMNLATLSSKLAPLSDTVVRFECPFNSTVAPNMTAAIGALIARAEARGCRVDVIGPSPDRRKLLIQNGFLKPIDDRISAPIINHRWLVSAHQEGAGIPYRWFALGDSKPFAEYANTCLTGLAIPEMSVLFQKRLLQVLNEIFNNAAIHSKSEFGIFCAGRSERHRLEITIVDDGVGFKTNVSRFLKRELTPLDAIDWAMEDDHTTRSGPIPGGLGLKLIRTFVSRCSAALTVFSHNGLWTQKGDHVTRTSVCPDFQGSLVSLRVNTQNISSYIEPQPHHRPSIL